MSVQYTAHGKTMSLQEWGKELGVNWKTLWARIHKSNIPVEAALSKDFKKKPKPRDFNKLISKKCAWCGSEFLIPQCRDWREHCCSSVCKTLKNEYEKQQKLKERKRACVHCGKEFVPRLGQINQGKGLFCSNNCFIHSDYLNKAKTSNVAKWKRSN